MPGFYHRVNCPKPILVLFTSHGTLKKERKKILLTMAGYMETQQTKLNEKETGRLQI